jgi:asparagine synthase (glutamine-hydrolysing)
MCGLCGIYAEGVRADTAASIRRMLAALAHRGPDGEGVYRNGPVTLGHRRLSVLDLSPSGAQPMSLASSGITISYNGEVYNFQALRRALETAGETFRGRSDTEVVLRAYQAWGLAGLQRLEGIFALALWDPCEKRLVLMRDRFGVKPLFYARAAGQLMFASEIGALLAAADIDRAIDPQAFAEYLWFGNPYEDRTIYREVRALPAGHWLVVEQGRERLEPWWRIEQWLGLPPPHDEFQQCVAGVRAALDTAVARQLVADVPVAIFLSGGIDSSAVACSAARAQSHPIASYSAGFDFARGINELPVARSVAVHLGLIHHELHIAGSDLVEVMLHLAAAHGEPFADAANIPLYLLARELRGSIKVVLQGDGGDEVFAGYRRYAVLQYFALWRLWPRFLSDPLRRLGRTAVRAARMLEAAGTRDPGERMARLLTLETPADSPFEDLESEARAALQESADPLLAYRRCAERFGTADPVRQMLLTDLTLQLPSQFLAKVDRATMAQGIEARVPLLDESVAELAVRMPTAWKVRGLKKKRVLREALRGRLSPAVLDRPKTGFGVPYGHWLRTSLHGVARDALLDSSFCQRYGLRRARLELLLREHRAGTRDRSFRLWKLLQLALWTHGAQQQRPAANTGGCADDARSAAG